MLTGLDAAVGRILGKLREHKLDENTLIFFYSDNGGPTPQTSSSNNPLRGFKAQTLEGGIRVPFLIQWKAKVPAGGKYTQPIVAFDIHATALLAAGKIAKGPSLFDRLSTSKRPDPFDFLRLAKVGIAPSIGFMME